MIIKAIIIWLSIAIARAGTVPMMFEDQSMKISSFQHDNLDFETESKSEPVSREGQKVLKISEFKEEDGRISFKVPLVEIDMTTRDKNEVNYPMKTMAEITNEFDHWKLPSSAILMFAWEIESTMHKVPFYEIDCDLVTDQYFTVEFEGFPIRVPVQDMITRQENGCILAIQREHSLRPAFGTGLLKYVHFEVDVEKETATISKAMPSDDNRISIINRPREAIDSIEYDSGYSSSDDSMSEGSDETSSEDGSPSEIQSDELETFSDDIGRQSLELDEELSDSNIENPKPMYTAIFSTQLGSKNTQDTNDLTHTATYETMILQNIRNKGTPTYRTVIETTLQTADDEEQTESSEMAESPNKGTPTFRTVIETTLQTADDEEQTESSEMAESPNKGTPTFRTVIETTLESGDDEEQTESSDMTKSLNNDAPRYTTIIETTLESGDDEEQIESSDMTKSLNNDAPRYTTIIETTLESGDDEEQTESSEMAKSPNKGTPTYRTIIETSLQTADDEEQIKSSDMSISLNKDTTTYTTILRTTLQSIADEDQTGPSETTIAPVVSTNTADGADTTPKTLDSSKPEIEGPLAEGDDEIGDEDDLLTSDYENELPQFETSNSHPGFEPVAEKNYTGINQTSTKNSSEEQTENEWPTAGQPIRANDTHEISQIAETETRLNSSHPPIEGITEDVTPVANTSYQASKLDTDSTDSLESLSPTQSYSEPNSQQTRATKSFGAYDYDTKNEGEKTIQETRTKTPQAEKPTDAPVGTSNSKNKEVSSQETDQNNTAQPEEQSSVGNAGHSLNSTIYESGAKNLIAKDFRLWLLMLTVPVLIH